MVVFVICVDVCATCGHVVCEHFFSFGVQDGNQVSTHISDHIVLIGGWQSLDQMGVLFVNE
jgi:hypothetical protein